MKQRTQPIFWCLLSAAFFGASTPASKAILGDMSPLTLAGLLYFGAALAMIPFSFKGGSPELRRKPDQLLKMSGAVVFGGILGPVLILLGLNVASSASVALWLNLETVATAILGWLFFREHLDRRTWVAIGLVIIAGVILASPSGFGSLMPAIFVALGCLCWGFDNNFTAIIDGYTPAQTTLVKGLIAGIFNIALGQVLEGDPFSLGIWIAALVVGAFSYGVSIMLYIAGAQRLGATRSQMIFATSPFFGVLLSWTALGESIGIYQVISGLIIVVGLLVLFTGRHGHVHTHVRTRHTHGHSHDDDHHGHEHHDLPPSTFHTHDHEHEPDEHEHPHEPDLHHRHDH